MGRPLPLVLYGMIQLDLAPIDEKDKTPPQDSENISSNTTEGNTG